MKNANKKTVIAIVGPTASGKTSLSVELAKRLDTEIISADSRQIYKEFDIATAKPSQEEMQGIKHHLMDFVEPTKDFTVADFKDQATKVMETLFEQNKTPIVVGGTGLYFRILLENYDLPRVAPNKELREELEKKSSEELYKILLEKDNELAQKIHFNNKVKIIRALEVCLTLNMPMSKAQKKKESEYNTLWIGLNAFNREYLYNNVNKRVDIMMEQGLLDEAKNLFDKYGDNNILLSTIGYQELYPFIKSEINLETAIEQIKQNTRRYTKRQISWFNANKDINWYDIEILSKQQIYQSALDKYCEM